jgi:hypothetical protein
MDPTFTFKSKIWLWNGEKGSWHFINLPFELSKRIKGFNEGPKQGFGSIRVNATIGDTTWKTSIFPEKKGTYVLPLKKDVRKKEKLNAKDTVEATLSLKI